MNLLPAVLLGGPPHSGKSVLAYSLTHALREQGIQHYVLRAAPDGEGDWANEADQELVRIIRAKGEFSQDFVRHVCDSLARRHMPLLVDVGGRPTPEQEVVFDYCTHAILLYKDETELEFWQAIAERHNLIVIAILRSDLDAAEAITDSGPVLRGTIGGLARGALAAGPMVQALVQRLAGMFAYSHDELLNINLLDAPVEDVRIVEELASIIGVPSEGERYRWQPDHLKPVLELLPAGPPTAVYGRGPTWLYAAIAAHTSPALFWQFDVRLGWVQSLALRFGDLSPNAPLQIETHARPGHLHIEFRLLRAYLDYEEIHDLRVPEVAQTQGVVLSGKLPNWLWTSLTLAYRNAAWVGIYYPPLNGAVVVARSGANAPAVGSMV